MFGRRDAVLNPPTARSAAGAQRRATSLCASIALALAAHASIAAAITATPAPPVPPGVASATPTEPVLATRIGGQVLESVGGSGLAGATVEYHVAGQGSGVVITDAGGAFAFTLDLRHDDWVVVEVPALAGRGS